jgi:hypothetical protein
MKTVGSRKKAYFSGTYLANVLVPLYEWRRFGPNPTSRKLYVVSPVVRRGFRKRINYLIRPCLRFAARLNVRLPGHDRGTPPPPRLSGLVDYLTDLSAILELGQAPYALDRAAAAGQAVVRSRRLRAHPPRTRAFTQALVQQSWDEEFVPLRISDGKENRKQADYCSDRLAS